jgi:cytoskeletal protein CcmA (bactofilin family)
MFRPGKNPKDTHDDTADHTPQTSSTPSYGSAGAGSSSSQSAAGGSDYSANTATSRAVSESESLARDIKEGTLAGFVGNGTSLTGEANFKGMLRVDGTLSGRVSSTDGTLIVSTNGQVDANVEVAVAQIFGTVNGDIIASKRIEMGRVARVVGNIQTPALVIESGAIFEGSCRMVQLREEQDKGTAKAGASTSAAATGSSSSYGSSSTSSSSSSSTSSKGTDKGSSSSASPSADVTSASDAVS